VTKQDQQRADRILAFIREAVAERGYPPSVREIAEAVGLASTSAVHHHLTKLEKDGRLNKEATRSRALSLPGMTGGRVVQAPVIGEIAAGQPIHAYEDRSETMGLPSELAAGRGRETFVLRVRGKSMIDDHIDSPRWRHRRRCARGQRCDAEALLQREGPHPAAARERRDVADLRTGRADPREGHRRNPQAVLAIDLDARSRSRAHPS